MRHRALWSKAHFYHPCRACVKPAAPLVALVLIARVYQLQSLSRGALVPRYRKGTALLPRFVRHGAPESPASREVGFTYASTSIAIEFGTTPPP